MSLSRLRSQGKTRPLTSADVIDNALRGHTLTTRRDLVRKVQGELVGKGMLAPPSDTTD